MTVVCNFCKSGRRSGVTLETKQLRLVSRIPVQEIAQVLADKYEIQLGQHTLWQRLYGCRVKEVPFLDEAMYLVNALRKVKNENPRLHFVMKRSEVGRLQHIVFALPG